jgi:hypothetical protein
MKEYRKTATDWCVECKMGPMPNDTCRMCYVTHARQTDDGVEIGIPSNFDKAENEKRQKNC